MKLILALLTVLFFHFLYVDSQRIHGMVIQFQIEYPLVGVLTGLPLAAMAGPCLGRQTPFKRRLSLLGVMFLHFVWVLMMLVTSDHRATFASSLPFLAASVPLLVKRLREDPEKEEADRKAKLATEKARRKEIHAALAKKTPGTP